MIKPDLVFFSSLFDNYLNYANPTDDIAISGSIANGANQTFSVTIPFTRANSRADVYFISPQGTKAPANSGTRVPTLLPTYYIYQFASNEIATTIIDYSSSSITVGINIANFTGGAISLVTQTIQVSVVQYDAPLSTIS